MLRTVVTFLALGLTSTALAADAPKKLLLLGQGPDGHPPQRPPQFDRPRADARAASARLKETVL